ncbi:hypothetical protein SAMN05444920_10948 [Nonomuraea solani]|uniref:Uncharacterized protein n=1 Tax=Nonomuraea solani TaxID=1144553 RepID=A0A1H6EC85_9ACTN|nr:hypothetical protein SAMN05444920_10948 [Nonomuraea solani]
MTPLVGVGVAVVLIVRVVTVRGKSMVPGEYVRRS